MFLLYHAYIYLELLILTCTIYILAPYQFIDMKEKGMSKGEFTSVAQVNGGLENMINWEGRDKDTLALVKYIADEDKLTKVLENPQVIKTPVVRNGKQSTLGYQPNVWKSWK
ncbi:ArsC family transcriptional regulator [Blautia glucerasea]|nr:ArsC/Spx/MgsR family protein [Blautia glucerasea]MCB6546020.1 ArsC family transcriptional regulator [Blautia glucerasea]